MASLRSAAAMPRLCRRPLPEVLRRCNRPRRLPATPTAARSFATAGGEADKAASQAKQTAGEVVKGKVQSAAEEVADTTKAMAGKVTETAQDIAGKAKKVARDAWGAAEERTQKVKETVAGKAERAADAAD